MVYVSHTKSAAKLIIKSTLWLFFKKKITIIRYRLKLLGNRKKYSIALSKHWTIFSTFAFCFSWKICYWNLYVY